MIAPTQSEESSLLRSVSQPETNEEMKKEECVR